MSTTLILLLCCGAHCGVEYYTVYWLGCMSTTLERGPTIGNGYSFAGILSEDAWRGYGYIRMDRYSSSVLHPTIFSLRRSLMLSSRCSLISKPDELM